MIVVGCSPEGVSWSAVLIKVCRKWLLVCLFSVSIKPSKARPSGTSGAPLLYLEYRERFEEIRWKGGGSICVKHG